MKKKKDEVVYKQMSGRGRRPDNVYPVIDVTDVMKQEWKNIPDHGIFERQNSGIVWKVLNYKDHYLIWEYTPGRGYHWSNDNRLNAQYVYMFSLKPMRNIWKTPCFKTISLQTGELVKVVRNNSSFYVKNTTTGNIYIVNKDDTAELLYDNEDEFLRIQEYLHK